MKISSVLLYSLKSSFQLVMTALSLSAVIIFVGLWFNSELALNLLTSAFTIESGLFLLSALLIVPVAELSGNVLKMMYIMVVDSRTPRMIIDKDTFTPLFKPQRNT